MKQYYTYILKCCDNSYYTGVTNDIERRLIEHNSSEFIKSYCHSRRPVILSFCETFDAPLKAIAFEKQIKGWTRAKKEALIEGNYSKLKELAKCMNPTSHVFFKTK